MLCFLHEINQLVLSTKVLRGSQAVGWGNVYTGSINTTTTPPILPPGCLF